MYRAFFPAFTSGNTDVGKLLFMLFYSRFFLESGTWVVMIAVVMVAFLS